MPKVLISMPVLPAFKATVLKIVNDLTSDIALKKSAIGSDLPDLFE